MDIYSQSGVDYILVGSKYASTSDVYLESLNFDSTCVSSSTDSYGVTTCNQYRYDTRTRLTSLISETYNWVESLVIDQTNSMVYAHVTTRKSGFGDKGGLMIKCDLILTESTCSHVSSE